jgi:hypothetical protein
MLRHVVRQKLADSADVHSAFIIKTRGVIALMMEAVKHL